MTITCQQKSNLEKEIQTFLKEKKHRLKLVTENYKDQSTKENFKGSKTKRWYT